MSVHVGLTGVRALSMPFLGLLANHLLGNASFVISIFVAGGALLLFRRLADESTRAAPPGDGTNDGRDTPSTGSNTT